MSLYFFSAKYSNAAFKGMVDTPQDREAAANKLFNAMGVKMHNFTSASAAQKLLEFWRAMQKTWRLWKW